MVYVVGGYRFIYVAYITRFKGFVDYMYCIEVLLRRRLVAARLLRIRVAGR
jgi:hypothetical protein